MLSTARSAQPIYVDTCNSDLGEVVATGSRAILATGEDCRFATEALQASHTTCSTTHRHVRVTLQGQLQPACRAGTGAALLGWCNIRHLQERLRFSSEGRARLGQHEFDVHSNRQAGRQLHPRAAHSCSSLCALQQGIAPSVLHKPQRPSFYARAQVTCWSLPWHAAWACTGAASCARTHWSCTLFQIKPVWGCTTPSLRCM